MPAGERIARNEQRISDLSERVREAATKSDLEGLENRVIKNNTDTLASEMKAALNEMRAIAKHQAESAFDLMLQELAKREEAAREREEQRKTDWKGLAIDLLKISAGPIAIFLIARAMGASGSEAVEISSAFS